MMIKVDHNHFTCTLAEAIFLRKHDIRLSRSFQTVLGLINDQARYIPNSPALGFVTGRECSTKKKPDLVSFAELDKLSRIAAARLRQTLLETKQYSVSTTVGLFCYSSLDLVLSWLGLLRLGYKALFLAPQLDIHAIKHLCQEVGIRVVLVDASHRSQLSQIQGDIYIRRIPNYHDKGSEANEIPSSIEKGPSSSVAFLQHTSGTSSGLPKPIFQTEWGAVGCLPVFTEANPKATFTTTPFYHGGVADALRAWTSGAMIWFFPEGELPITSKNIEEAVDLARRRSGMVPVNYFSSVPYVLQMLAEAERSSGVEMLKSMDLVGVGGAPFPPVIGDKLVKSGVKLLSRMGSAECGFLMSSHRQYSNDGGWQYLRAVDDHKLLDFEPQDDGLYELVVKPGWPLRLKTNREDGSYATADLFEPHPWDPNTWRYHGRKDALIILANGKKFDPSPIEDELRYSNVLLRDVLVFGTGRSYPGALLFTNCRYLSDDQCLEKVWPNIRTLNSLLPQPSRLSRHAIVIVQVEEGEDTLPRSSKGSILRCQAENRYAKIIDKVYTSPRRPLERAHISDNELVPFISGLFKEVLGRQINPEEDVFTQGVNSIDCVHITKQIQDTLFSSQVPLLPRNVIYDNGTILGLVNTLKRTREGGDYRVQGHEEESVLLMRQLVQKFSDVDIPGAGTSRKDVVVVLTGASGMLGAHILDRLIDDSRVSKIYCLLRGKTRFAAEERIVKALVKRKLRSEKELRCSGAFQNMVCLPCDLSAPYLGLSDKDRLCITDEATHIIHSAWTVNFNLGLRHFETQLANTQNLIHIANVSGAEFFFISSTAAVCNMVSKTVPEKISSEPRDASALGYSKSKWVAEQVCAAARSQKTETGSEGSRGKPRVSIIRVGQLCGNESGIWNASEAYPLLLSTAKVISCLPDLPGKCLNWLPVDIAAKSIMEIVLSHCNENIAARSCPFDVPVYHVLNPHRSPSWRQMLDWFLKEPGSIPFNIVPAPTWMELLEVALAADPGSKHPWQVLMGMWKRQYVLNENDHSVDSSAEAPTFEVGFTQHVSQSIHRLKPLSRERLLLMWAWVQETC
ncbi:hypothetical protein F4860DRAFT_523227 [Xylaria cubensis]|nr:hypothetical protein F4860DRAFT_523227 [Xylaria cubensis]